MPTSAPETRVPQPGRERSWWLRDALAAEADAAPATPLHGRVRADVAIVGGGYTGMWAAYFLTERLPGARITLLEADICGGGPSGRNGGFAHGWWEDLPYLVRRYGREDGLAIARAADEVVDGIGEWCVKHDVDAWYTKSGYVTVNAFPNFDPKWERLTDVMADLGAPDALKQLSAAEVTRVCASPAFGNGLLMPSAASVQPARLARGLRRVLLERGVTIHESTRVRAVRGTGPLEITSDHGWLTADQAILAVNAWAAGWPGFRSRVLVWGSYMVITEPIPERIAEMRWTDGELLSDARFTISYFRTTRDGRIAFGAGVGAAGYGGRIGRTYTDDRRAVERVVANFRHLFPMLADVGFDDAWGGPIDITGDKFPEIGSTRGGRIHFAHGYGGNGVGPSRLAGRILAARVANADDPLVGLPLVGRRQPVLPPEPFRFIGARTVREALIRQDDALDAGRRPSPIFGLIARLPRALGYRLGH